MSRRINGLFRDERKSGLNDLAGSAARLERTVSTKKGAGTSLGPALSAVCLFAQDSVPGFLGVLAWLNTTHAGVANFHPIIAPLLVVPSGDRCLVESRAVEVLGFYARENGTKGA